jgi:hypothetical protein
MPGAGGIGLFGGPGRAELVRCEAFMWGPRRRAPPRSRGPCHRSPLGQPPLVLPSLRPQWKWSWRVSFLVAVSMDGGVLIKVSIKRDGGVLIKVSIKRRRVLT